MEDVSTVFLGRDGVINRLRSDYVTSWDTLEFLPRAKDAIRMLSAAGMRVVVVTNQRAVARGLLSIAELSDICCIYGGAHKFDYSGPQPLGEDPQN